MSRKLPCGTSGLESVGEKWPRLLRLGRSAWFITPTVVYDSAREPSCEMSDERHLFPEFSFDGLLWLASTPYTEILTKEKCPESQVDMGTAPLILSFVTTRSGKRPNMGHALRSARSLQSQNKSIAAFYSHVSVSAKPLLSELMAIVRIAIAGSGGLAQHLAYFINQTAHLFIILSRAPKPGLVALGYQVVVVDYESQMDLIYALRGTDLVISTISGIPQMNLIDAASRAEVRRFVPSEFEGPPTRRANDDPFDRGRAASLAFLEEISSRNNRHPMRFTTFTCGIFYERFARGGLASKGIGLGSGLEAQGAYLLDIEHNTGELIEYNASGQPVFLCLTSLTDVARFVVAALSLGINNWPVEYRMMGDRKTVTEIIEYAEAIKEAQFSIIVYTAAELREHLGIALTYQNVPQSVRLQALTATLERHYDYRTANLNGLVDVQPTNLWDWMQRHWTAPPAAG